MDAFYKFRNNTIGYNATFTTPYGNVKMIYADWTATGRLYLPIEETIQSKFGPFMGNTHSGTSVTGSVMSEAYHYAANLIKSRVCANAYDVLVPCGTGVTSAINKLQRILGIRVHEKLQPYLRIPDELRPVIFITHMEHHSNHTSWLETIGDVVCLPPNEDGLVKPTILNDYLKKYSDRRLKIGSFTACSNVTGIMTPYYTLAKVMHKHGGVCFVDFAACAPYTKINMHPEDPLEQLDAIFLSPHKFLGGPGSCGLLVFNSALYANAIPDHPGGGTVEWTNPWGEKAYIHDIEVREDGGTPGILQLIRAALAFQMKDELLQAGMLEREKSIVAWALAELNRVPDLYLLDRHIARRLAIFSFHFPHLHYNLVVRLLNDRFGIQSRGGCSCAGTYGHYLMNIDKDTSKQIADRIDHHDLSRKPGWARISLHPMMTDAEIRTIIYALHEISIHGSAWARDYTYDRLTNEFTHKDQRPMNLANWFATTVLQ